MTTKYLDLIKGANVALEVAVDVSQGRRENTMIYFNAMGSHKQQQEVAEMGSVSKIVPTCSRFVPMLIQSHPIRVFPFLSSCSLRKVHRGTGEVVTSQEQHPCAILEDFEVSEAVAGKANLCAISL